MENVLVIAYGNPLRCDDGIAWQAAAEIRRSLPASAQVICVHQLTPEVAENASRADVVIFLDAAIGGEPGRVACRPVTAKPGELRFSHHLGPPDILAICERLYYTKPRGFLLSIHGTSFDHGEEFSPAAIHAVPRVVELVGGLVGNLLREAGTQELSSRF